MALTAYPVVAFSPATGSDTAASGAGPVTAVTGTTNAVTNSTTITFAGAPDLSGVVQDGSHVLWINGVGFVRISTVDNIAKSIVVENAVTVASGTAFAIGGKRAQFNSTESARLFALTSVPTAVGMAGGWVVETDNSGSHASATTLNITAQAPPASQPPMIFRGTGLTPTEVSCSGSNVAVITVGSASSFIFQNLQLRHTHATVKGAGFAHLNFSLYLEVRDCIIGSADGINCPSVGFNRNNGTGNLFLVSSSVLRCGSFGVHNYQAAWIVNSDISGCGNTGINAIWNCTVIGSVVSHNAGAGIAVNLIQGGQNTTITNTTVHGNSGDGFAASNASVQFVKLLNNQLTANGGYGINLSDGTPHYIIAEGNNLGNASDSTANTSGPVNGVTLSATNTTNPARYVDPSSSVRNFAIAPPAQGGGYPTGPIGQSATRTYLDKGASQHPNPAAGFVIGG